MHGSGDPNEETQRFDPADVTQVDRTAYIPPRDDSAGYAVPHQQTAFDRSGAQLPQTTFDPSGAQLPQTTFDPSGSQPSRIPSQTPPSSLPQRVPAPIESVPVPSGTGSGGGTGTRTGTSVRIGKGVTPATLRRSRDGRATTRLWFGHATRVLSVIATIVLIGAAAWTGWQWWQHFHNKVAVTSVDAEPAQQLDGRCDVQYDIVGTITTNGKSGTIAYVWQRSDGQSSGTLHQSVSSGQNSTTVHLYWKFTGEGSLNATATLHILSPTAGDATAHFRYSCA
jgi:hypothetical protein